jgi:hypothetical protein
MDIGLEKVCHGHCWILAGVLGLKTSRSKTGLDHRLSLIGKEGEREGMAKPGTTLIHPPREH